MASAVFAHRRDSGDFGRFSVFSQSTDTAATIRIVERELSGGAAYGTLATGDLTAHAIKVASQSTGLWMQKNGVPSGASNALSDDLAAVTRGLRIRRCSAEAGTAATPKYGSIAGHAPRQKGHFGALFAFLRKRVVGCFRSR